MLMQSVALRQLLRQASFVATGKGGELLKRKRRYPSLLADATRALMSRAEADATLFAENKCPVCERRERSRQFANLLSVLGSHHVHVRSIGHVSLLTRDGLLGLGRRAGFQVIGHEYCGGRDLALHDILSFRLARDRFVHRMGSYAPRVLARVQPARPGDWCDRAMAGRWRRARVLSAGIVSESSPVNSMYIESAALP